MQEGMALPLSKKDLDESPNGACPKCLKEVVVPIYVLKIVSALRNPTGKEIIVPHMIGYRCAACKKVWKDVKTRKERKGEVRR